MLVCHVPGRDWNEQASHRICSSLRAGQGFGHATSPRRVWWLRLHIERIREPCSLQVLHGQYLSVEVLRVPDKCHGKVSDLNMLMFLLIVIFLGLKHLLQPLQRRRLGRQGASSECFMLVLNLAEQLCKFLVMYYFQLSPYWLLELAITNFINNM